MVINVTMVCHHTDLHADGRVKTWKVRARKHEHTGEPPQNEQHAVAADLHGQEVILKSYAGCPECGETGTVDEPGTWYVI